MTRTINAAGLALVKRNEGLRLASYQDVAGIWSIGYGHTPASPGQTITDAEAEKLLFNDIAFACAIVSDATGMVTTTDDQFSAMSSLAFNIGIQAFRTSSVVRLHQAGNTSGAADAFLMWDKAHVDGQLVVVAGLHNRRVEERALYLSEPAAGGVIVSPVPPSSVPTVPPLRDLQAGLNATGAGLAVDGQWGPHTAAAIAAYYRSHSGG